MMYLSWEPGNLYGELQGKQPFAGTVSPQSVYQRDKFVFKNGKMDVPYSPFPQYLELNQISLDSEMVQTLVEHSKITQVDIQREVSIQKLEFYINYTVQNI